MNLIFIGPQASGKGTQAKIISKKLNIPHVSTGDLVRNSEGDLKQKIDFYILKGNLVPDELMIKILKKRLEKEDCKKGFILDGFPRTLPQAEALDNLIEIDKIVEINISDKEAIRRLSGRRNCNTCGAIYNLNTSPKPKQENICDTCNEILSQRQDDYPESIKKRLEIYHKNTKPILKRYTTLRIDGEQEIEEVSKDILEKLLV